MPDTKQLTGRYGKAWNRLESLCEPLQHARNAVYTEDAYGALGQLKLVEKHICAAIRMMEAQSEQAGIIPQPE